MIKRSLDFLERNKTFPFAMVIIICVFIFFISSLSYPPAPHVSVFDFSIVYHFMIFFLLAFFLIALINNKRVSFSSLMLAFFLAFIYAVTDEVHQLFIQNRVADFFDLFIDSLGISSSLLLYSLLSLKR